MIIVSPSILGADFSNLRNEINRGKNAQMMCFGRSLNDKQSN